MFLKTTPNCSQKWSEDVCRIKFWMSFMPQAATNNIGSKTCTFKWKCSEITWKIMSASLKIAKFSLNDIFFFLHWIFVESTKQKIEKNKIVFGCHIIQIDRHRHTHTPTLENCFIFTFIYLQYEWGKLIVLLLILSDYTFNYLSRLILLLFSIENYTYIFHANRQI